MLPKRSESSVCWEHHSSGLRHDTSVSYKWNRVRLSSEEIREAKWCSWPHWRLANLRKKRVWGGRWDVAAWGCPLQSTEREDWAFRGNRRTLGTENKSGECSVGLWLLMSILGDSLLENFTVPYLKWEVHDYCLQDKVMEGSFYEWWHRCLHILWPAILHLGVWFKK